MKIQKIRQLSWYWYVLELLKYVYTVWRLRVYVLSVYCIVVLRTVKNVCTVRTT